MPLRPAGIRLPQGPLPRIIFFFIATAINNIVMVVTGMIAMLTIATAQCCR